jgi:hypothetical protein
MRGQALALHVKDGGWLKHGTQTFGVDLQLSDTPVYEWYALGTTGSNRSSFPGNPIDSGDFALWNRSAQDFLVAGHQTWGVDVNWYRKTQAPPPSSPAPVPGIKTVTIYNCSWPLKLPYKVWISDLTAGGGFTERGEINSNYTAGGSCGPSSFSGTPFRFTPESGHRYSVIAVSYQLQAYNCTNEARGGSPCNAMEATFVGDSNGVDWYNTPTL